MPWAVANSNLALVKYWGKAGPGNEPAGSSLSVTLDGLTTAAEVTLDPGLDGDSIEWRPAGPSRAVAEFLREVRRRLDVTDPMRVTLASNFPVAAGLASSASTFAALATAAVAAAGRRLDTEELASLARLGSGSACRSIPGGFVEWRADRGGSRVVPIAGADHWPLRVIVAVTREEPKTVGSREGMRRTEATSPYYASWLATGQQDLDEVRAAVLSRDFSRLGPIVERNCMRMHAAAIAADPPLLYWEPATVAVVREVWRLRARGIEAYFSIDAGPQVKVLCLPGDAPAVEAALGGVPGVRRLIRSRPGGPARVLGGPPEWLRDETPRSGVAAG